jgi:hypothetical protein
MAFYIVLLQAALIVFHKIANDSGAEKLNKWVFVRLNEASILFSIAIAALGLLLIFFYGYKLYQYQKLIKGIRGQTEESKNSRIVNILIESMMYLIFTISSICSSYLAIMFIRFTK